MADLRLLRNPDGVRSRNAVLPDRRERIRPVGPSRRPARVRAALHTRIHSGRADSSSGAKRAARHADGLPPMELRLAPRVVPGSRRHEYPDERACDARRNPGKFRRKSSAIRQSRKRADSAIERDDFGLKLTDAQPLSGIPALWRLAALLATLVMGALALVAALYFGRPILLPVVAALIVGITLAAGGEVRPRASAFRPRFRRSSWCSLAAVVGARCSRSSPRR